MTDFNIRLTRRTEIGGRAHEETIDIDFGAPRHGQLIAGSVELAADPDPDTHVAGDAGDMAQALSAISLELGCANTLDDMLHAIDALRATPALEWSATLCNGERVKHAAAEKACAALGEGWRLPTRVELLGLVDDTRSEPAIDTARFPDTKSGAYWTSTLFASDSSVAWIVLFDDGYAYGFHRVSDLAFVRAVRSVPAGQ